MMPLKLPPIPNGEVKLYRLDFRHLSKFRLTLSEKSVVRP